MQWIRRIPWTVLVGIATLIAPFTFGPELFVDASIKSADPTRFSSGAISLIEDLRRHRPEVSGCSLDQMRVLQFGDVSMDNRLDNVTREGGGIKLEFNEMYGFISVTVEPLSGDYRVYERTLRRTVDNPILGWGDPEAMWNGAASFSTNQALTGQVWVIIEGSC